MKIYQATIRINLYSPEFKSETEAEAYDKALTTLVELLESKNYAVGSHYVTQLKDLGEDIVEEVQKATRKKKEV